MATEGNYKELVKYFIEKGADINKRNNEGNRGKKNEFYR